MSKHPPEFWAKMEQRFLELAEQRTRDTGSLGHCDAMRSLHLGHRALLRVRDGLIAKGKLVNLGVNLGVAVPGVVVPTRTLSGVLRAASDRLCPSASPKRGRRIIGDHGNTLAFTAGQLVKMRTAVSFLERIDRARDTQLTVSPFRRHVVSDEWELLYGLDRLSEFLALGEASQRAHKSALRLLLSFAENEGLLGEDPSGREDDILAAEWVSWIDAHRIEENASANVAKDHRFGLRMLARLAGARGWLAASDVEWATVLDDARAARDGGLYSNEKYEKILRAYRRLLYAGAVKGPTASKNRCLVTSLVDQATLHRGVDGCDYSDWCARDGTPIPDLAFELRRHHVWRSAEIPASHLKRETPPLPIRSFGNGRGAFAPFVLKKSSLRTTWNHLLHYAGWLVSKDLSRASGVRLSTLISLDNWELFVEESLARRGLDPVDGANSTLSGLAQNLAVLADPYLSAEARRVGDDALASELLKRGTFFRAETLRLQPGRGEFDGAREKVSAWESDGTSGYEKLDLLRKLIEKEIIARGNGLSILDQLTHVRAGTLPTVRHCMQWATAVRDYVMLSILRRVPLRLSNLVGLQITDEPPQRLRSGRKGAKCEWWVDDAARPWAGPITLRIASAESKNAESAQLPLITRDDCGASDAELDLGRDVLELYLQHAGARALLLRKVTGSATGKYVLVASSRHARTKSVSTDRPWRAGSAGRRFTELVSRSCQQLGLDRELAAATQGALGIHVVRHLFGSWFTEHEQLEFAAAMLMHSSTETLERHYKHLTPRALSIDKRRRRIA